MYESNIIAGSNVFLSREEDKFWDEDFARQVQDYKLIKYMHDRRKIDSRICNLTGKQQAILNSDMRCLYAKNDPCWGYVESRKKMVCACINNECSQIYRCNKDYTIEQSLLWSMTDEEIEQYGHPELIRKYYIVDLVSDEEMEQYNYIHDVSDRTFSIKNHIIQDEQKSTKKKELSRIDPATGRKMVVVGYEWRITDNSNYESEKLIAIWDFSDEIEINKPLRKKIKKVKKIEEKEKKSLQKNAESSFDERERNRIKNLLNEKVVSIKKLTEIEENDQEFQNTSIILVNEAEKAYVSSMLLLNKVEHGFEKSDSLQLLTIYDCEKISDDKTIWLSSQLLKIGCTLNNIDKWKFLINKKCCGEITISDRDYCNFEIDFTDNWCCKNIYGVTHVCLKEDDIESFYTKEDGIYNVSLVDNNSTYMILQSNGDILGYTNEKFAAFIKYLRKMNEIPGTPAVIKGITIKVKNEKLFVLGMGHLKFIEY